MPAHVRFDGRDITNATPRESARAGLVHVVEGHRVFTQFSVPTICCWRAIDVPRGSGARVEEALAFFPRSPPSGRNGAARCRAGNSRCLPVAQGLVRRPRLLMLDEPSAGLSPVLVDRVLSVVLQAARSGDVGAAGRAAGGEGAAAR